MRLAELFRPKEVAVDRRPKLVEFDPQMLEQLIERKYFHDFNYNVKVALRGAIGQFIDGKMAYNAQGVRKKPLFFNETFSVSVPVPDPIRYGVEMDYSVVAESNLVEKLLEMLGPSLQRIGARVVYSSPIQSGGIGQESQFNYNVELKVDMPRIYEVIKAVVLGSSGRRFTYDEPIENIGDAVIEINNHLIQMLQQRHDLRELSIRKNPLVTFSEGGREIFIAIEFTSTRKRNSRFFETSHYGAIGAAHATLEYLQLLDEIREIISTYRV